MNDSNKKDKVILDEIKELIIKINYHDQMLSQKKKNILNTYTILNKN